MFVKLPYTRHTRGRIQTYAYAEWFARYGVQSCPAGKNRQALRLAAIHFQTRSLSRQGYQREPGTHVVSEMQRATVSVPKFPPPPTAQGSSRGGFFFFFTDLGAEADLSSRITLLPSRDFVFHPGELVDHDQFSAFPEEIQSLLSAFQSLLSAFPSPRFKKKPDSGISFQKCNVC